LIGAVIDDEGRIKRWIFHDPYGDQTQHPSVEGYYDGKSPPSNKDLYDKDSTEHKGAYAPYGPGINSYSNPVNFRKLESNYVVWWLNPTPATVENIRSRLLPSEPPNGPPPTK
jgi:hypothetical protein